MKILLTNTVALNGGDAAILISIANLIYREFGSDTELVIYDSQPEIAQRYYPNYAFRKLIYLKATAVPPLKFLGRSLLGRVIRRLISRTWRFLADSNPPRIYAAAWCWQHRLLWLAKLLATSAELQDLQHYRSADLIISTGGTYLVESYSPLTARIFDYQLSLLFQKPLVFFTQSLGPYHNPSYQQQFRQIFDRALLILLRDEASRQNLRAIQVNLAQAIVSADVVFSFESATAALLQGQTCPIEGRGRLRVAISVRGWRHFQTTDATTGMNQFRAAIAALVQDLVTEQQAEITFLSTCQGIPEYWTDDSRVAHEIVESLPREIRSQVQVNSAFHSPDQLVALLQTFDFVVATRMHMAILSLVANTPVLPIAYEFKTKELFQRLGMGHWVQDIETVEATDLTAAARSFVEQLPETQAHLSTQVRPERLQAQRSIKQVKAAYMQWCQARSAK